VPECKVPIGYSFGYRAALATAGWSSMAYVMYWGSQGENGAGWLLIGGPFAFAAALAIQVVIQKIIPPRRDVHAEGNTWMKLN
jgi:hypothetical protein